MLAPPESEKSECASPKVRPQRLLKLISLLESGNVLTGPQLANIFHVCRRTIFRDIRILRSANVPIVFDFARAGYRVQREASDGAPANGVMSAPPRVWVQNGEICRCPKIMADEIVALLLAIRAVGPLPDKVAGACESALAKILATALPSARAQAIAILENCAEGAGERPEEMVLQLRPSG